MVLRGARLWQLQGPLCHHEHPCLPKEPPRVLTFQVTRWHIPRSPWSLSVLLLSYCPGGVWSAVHKQGLFCVGGCCDARSSEQEEGNAVGAQLQAWPLSGAALLPSAQVPLLPSAWAPLLHLAACWVAGEGAAFSLLVSLLSPLSSLLSSSSFLSLSLPFCFLFVPLFFFFLSILTHLWVQLLMSRHCFEGGSG